ncbi:hypothetical protein DPMN_088557 [Dreissena polymorpha]|uniref:Uncharacterized protein n=1 Tax=Dreissena polymorpha TaxID=45954 RepID=A0A9D4KV82_DREPO|nr:hypothetical protein DPMN_088557 [Dreissena polymorpha]
MNKYLSQVGVKHFSCPNKKSPSVWSRCVTWHNSTRPSSNLKVATSPKSSSNSLTTSLHWNRKSPWPWQPKRMSYCTSMLTDKSIRPC